MGDVKGSARPPVSIRTRLLVLVLGATVLTWLVAVTWSYLDARRELAELFDAQLAQAGRIVAARAEHDVEEVLEHGGDSEFDGGPDHRYEQSLHFQVWSTSGRLLLRSSPDLPREPIVPIGARGFFDRTLHGVRWRVLALADRSGEFEVQICQRMDLRAALAVSVARNMLLPVAAALPALALLIWIAIDRGTRPLARLASELAARGPEEVTPLSSGERPAELAPLVRALDGLLARLRDRLDLERAFTADAAHELRTPLAGLKTQAQVALRARSDEEREHALLQVVRGTDRMTRLVQQLLTLARLEPGAAVALQPVDLGSVIDEVVAEFSAEAARRDVHLVRSRLDPATVLADRALLAVLLANLVENALRHGGSGGEVRIEAARERECVVVHVVDSGPGIPEAGRDRVLDRFHRLPGSGSGSGLGLSIVARIAALHHTRVTLDSGPDGKGLDARIALQATDPGGAAVPPRGGGKAQGGSLLA